MKKKKKKKKRKKERKKSKQARNISRSTYRDIVGYTSEVYK
jgi:hypothetical protein